MTERTVLILAKSPRVGRVKTRLVPPLTHDEAAWLAREALADTLTAALACPADRRILVLDGPPGTWLPSGIEVVPQHGRTLSDRLADAWSRPLGGLTLQIGMDTPQLTGADLDAAFTTLAADGTDAVLGPAQDGGWWAIGMRRADPTVFPGIPTSTAATGSLQRRALLARGWRVTSLPTMRDVDTIGDVVEVAAAAPGTRFAAAADVLLAGAAGRASR